MARILIYAMNYAPEVAGVGRYTGDIGNSFLEAGHEVAVVTTVPHYPGWKVQSPYRNWRWRRERRENLTIERCPLFLRERMGGLWRLIAPLSFAITSAPIAIWRALRFRPDVILCIEPTLMAAPVALLMARLIGAQTALHVQDLEVDAAFAVGHLARKAWLMKLGLAFERFMLRRFDQIVTISNAMAERLAAKGVDADRIAVVRNWVDLDAIKPLDRVSRYRVELGIAAGDCVVLYSGSIGAKQGLNSLIEAAERLAGRPDIRFVIAGEGPAKAGLIVRAGSAANVRFLPFQPYERLSEFLGLADLHVLPQTADAADLVLPSKLAGMLASGRRVIVTADEDTELASFVAGVAIRTPPGDVSALAAAIEREAGRRGDDASGVRARRRLAERLSRTESLQAFAGATVRRKAFGEAREMAEPSEQIAN